MNLRKILFKWLYTGIPKNYTLEALLEHATNNVDYYKKFKGCQLENFPVLTKDIIRSEFDNLKSDDLHKRDYEYNTSGGSTGEPVKFIQDTPYRRSSYRVKYEQKQWAGYEFGDPIVLLWGSKRDITVGTMGFKARIHNILKNCTFINSFCMSPQDMEKAVEIINKKKPKLILAYAQSIYELALYIKQNNMNVHSVGAIMTSANPLFGNMKNVIEEVFSTRVYNRYGSREVGDMASTGPGIEELKISTNSVYLEVVDEDGNPCPDGVEGDILVTGLANYAMPLIRYKIGDRGIMNRSKYNYPVLEKVVGRTTDCFMKEDGSKVYGGCFNQLLYFIDWIKSFQIVQKEYDFILINVVKAKDENEEDIDRITKEIKVVMGDNCKVEFKFVDEIEPSASGKHKYNICEISEKIQ